MNGSALHTGTPRPGTGGRFACTLDLFAAVLLLAADPSDETLAGLVARARSEAERAVLSGREAATDDVVFARLYQIARAQAATLTPAPFGPGGTTRWARTLAALGTLRHRQRAGLALYYLAGLSLAEVGRCLALRESEARRVLESGISSIVKQLGEPADVRRSLRTAGARLIAPAPQPAPTPEKPARMPRAVVRTLLAPVPDVEFAPAPRAIEDVVLPDAPRAPTSAPSAFRAWRSGGHPHAARLALAATIALLLAAVFVPAIAHDTEAPRVPRAPRDAPVHVTAPVARPHLGAPLMVTVERGDSLWLIAARTLGDARRWPEIWRLNKGRAMASARCFANADLITPGWKLRLPRRLRATTHAGAT